MIKVRTAHTADLDAHIRKAARALLDAVFEGDFGDHDWEHTLGGMHALVWEGAELIGHGAVVQRRLLHRGRAWRTGYVEGVAVRADRRGQGYGAAVMDALERVVRRGYERAERRRERRRVLRSAGLAPLARADFDPYPSGRAPHPRRGWRHLHPARHRATRPVQCDCL
jgi:GNAT superfamily N-acetyltransferase